MHAGIMRTLYTVIKEVSLIICLEIASSLVGTHFKLLHEYVHAGLLHVLNTVGQHVYYSTAHCKIYIGYNEPYIICVMYI